MPLNTNRMDDQQATTSMRTLLVINRRMAPTSMLSTQINSGNSHLLLLFNVNHGRPGRHQTTEPVP